MKIIAKKDFTINGRYYSENDEVDVKDIQELIVINEKGFIEPLTRKEISQFQKQLMKEEKDGTNI